RERDPQARADGGNQRPDARTEGALEPERRRAEGVHGHGRRAGGLRGDRGRLQPGHAAPDGAHPEDQVGGRMRARTTGLALAGVKTAVSKVDVKGLPVLSLGYSRGGGLAVEYAAEAPRHGLPVPDAVLSVFPAQAGDWSRLIDLKPIRHDTPIVFLVGQQDT